MSAVAARVSTRTPAAPSRPATACPPVPPAVQTSVLCGRSIGLRWAWTSSQSASTKAAALAPTAPGSTLATPVTLISRSPGMGPRTRTTRPTSADTARRKPGVTTAGRASGTEAWPMPRVTPEPGASMATLRAAPSAAVVAVRESSGS